MPRIKGKTGFPHSEETKRKMSERRKLNNPGGFKKGHKSNLGKKVPHTKEHNMKVAEKSIFQKGHNLFKKENHPLWKGGISIIDKRAYQRNWNLSRKERMAGRKRPEKCELCNYGVRICFDHDHKTGKFRGWLCTKCNTMVGFIEKNIEMLPKVIEYISNGKG